MSVGHIARLLEEDGISTVIIASGIYRDRLEAMSLPRTVITHHPMGRPIGAPGDHDTQRKVILAALDMLDNAVTGGEIKEISTRYLP